MTDFLQNASAFRYGLIVFEKLDKGWVPPAWFLWSAKNSAHWREY